MSDRDEALVAWESLLQGRLGPSDRVVLPVLSGSMAPLLPVGGRVEIAGVSRRPLSAGDILVFRHGFALTAHRLLAVLPWPGEPWLYQKGDANPRGGWIRRASVVGVATAALLPDGTRVALDTAEARRSAARLARRYFRWDIKKRLFGRGAAAAGPDGGASPSALVSGYGSLVTLAAVPARAAACRLRELAGSSTLVDEAGGALHTLDGPGSFIWDAIDGQRPLAEIVDLICREYDVSRDTAAADLLRFADALVEKGVLTLAAPAVG